MEGNSPELEVYRKLRYANYLIRRGLRKHLAEEGLTWAQFHALYHIDESGVPFSQLAEHLHCNASNLTGLIDRMQENGWVLREQSAEDRRVWLVKLTAHGSELKNRIIPEHMERIGRRMSCLTSEELERLDGLLQRLIEG